MFFFIKLLIKNVFATLFVKIIKNVCEKRFFLLNYMLKNVSQRFLTVLIKNIAKRFFIY
jgi:hypothetical protein